MKKVITRLYDFFANHRKWLIITLLASVLLLLAGVFNLQFNEDVAAFLPNSAENAKINYASQHIGINDKVFATVASVGAEPDVAMICEAMDFFAEALQQSDTAKFIKDINYFADPQKMFAVTNFVAGNLPFYLTPRDYERLDSLLAPDALRAQLAKNRELLLTPMGAALKSLLPADPLFLSSGTLQQLSEHQMAGSYQIQNGYIFNKAGSEGIVIIASRLPGSETRQNEQLVANIKTAAEATSAQFNDQIHIAFTGVAPIGISNANRIKTDTIISTALALVLILALLFYFFRDFRVLLTIIFPIAFGALFALAFLSIFREQISIIAIGAGSIMVGIAVNYPLHFLAHLQKRYTPKVTIDHIVSPLVTGNITTVGAFLSLIFISSSAMCDLGLFASMLLIGTILFVLIFLPHLIDTKRFARNRYNQLLQFSWLAKYKPERNKFIVFALLILTIPLFILSKKTTFESDMMAINYMTDEDKALNDKLLRETDTKNPVVYCVAEGDDIESALVHYEASKILFDSLEKSGLILQKTGVGDLLLSKKRQQEKIDLWNDFWREKRADFVQNLAKIAAEEGFSETAFQPFFSTLERDFAVQEFAYFAPIVNNYAGNFVSQEADKSLIFTLLQTSPENKNQLNKVIDERGNGSFAFSTTSMITKMVDLLSRDFDVVLYICAFIVFLFLTISFGRLELSLLTFLPLAVSWIWILGIMNLFDLKFNILNIILATFIFGQGDDYAIFVTEGLLYEHTHPESMLPKYKNSIILSALLMFIGIGALIVAQHPAMRSLAEVTIIGMVVVVVMAFVLPPLLFRWLTRTSGRQRTQPITIFAFLKSCVVFGYVSIGSFLLSIFGFFLLTIGGKSARHRMIFHKVVQKTLQFGAFIIPQISYRIENPRGEDLSKPAVIICNHSSQLDLLYTLILNPKIIVLTNRWVWHAPIYGWVLRYAEYFPIYRGVGEIIDKLQKKVDEGYSIMIFPEGTRSVDGEIMRFRQGAFLLADTLNVDILPIVLHGIGDAMPKKEPFLLRKGRVTIKYLDRIPPKDEKYRKFEHSKQTAKAFRQLFRTEYQALRDENETPSYFQNLVLQNYAYKTRDVERQAHFVLKKHFSDCEALISALPEEGKVLITNCGQGEIAILAALTRRKLQIFATDKRLSNIFIARYCATVPKNCRFLESYPKNVDEYDQIIEWKL